MDTLIRIINEPKIEIWQSLNIDMIVKAARTCYKSEHSEEGDKKLLQTLYKRKHFAMFEFTDMIVKFSDISRGFTHEMVRHRHCSFAQESTRYVEADPTFIKPPDMLDTEAAILASKIYEILEYKFKFL